MPIGNMQWEIAQMPNDSRNWLDFEDGDTVAGRWLIDNGVQGYVAAEITATKGDQITVVTARGNEVR